MGDYFITGLLQGVAGAKQQQLQSEFLQAQIKSVKANAKAEEAKLEQEARKQQVMQQLGRVDPVNQQTGQVSAPMLNAGQAPVQNKPLTERMAELSLPELDALGIKPTDIVKMQQQANFQKLFQGAMQGRQNAGQLGASPPSLGGLQQTGMTMGSGGNISLQFQDQTPEFVRTGRSFNIPENELRDIWKKKQMGFDVSQQLDALRASQISLENEMKIAELRKIRQQETEGKIQLQDSMDMDIERAFEAASLIDDLEGTALKTGELADMRRIGMGMWALVDQSKAEIVAKGQRFNKIATDFGVRTLEFLMKRGQISDIKFQTLMNNTLSSGNLPSANRQALADILDETLAADARSDEINIPDREKVEALVKRLRAASTKGFIYNQETGKLEPK